MLIILVVVLIFFGPKRLPDLAKSLGKGIAEFKKASEEVKKSIDDAMKEELTKEPTPAPMPEPANKQEVAAQPQLPGIEPSKSTGETKEPAPPAQQG
jgi:TatA/E family protein of Tat protein translocase